MSLYSSAVSSSSPIETSLEILPLGNVAYDLIASGLISWSNSSSWDNSSDIAGTRSAESKKYEVTNQKVGDIKKSMNISNFADTKNWLTKKANEQNTITETTSTTRKSWLGAQVDTALTYRYWQENNDQLLSRYGYETYAQKSTNLNESLKWMQVQDLNKLNDNVVIADVQDTAGQEVERNVASNQMNNYFGQYYVDKNRV